MPTGKKSTSNKKKSKKESRAEKKQASSVEGLSSLVGKKVFETIQKMDLKSKKF